LYFEHGFSSCITTNNLLRNCLKPKAVSVCLLHHSHPIVVSCYVSKVISVTVSLSPISFGMGARTTISSNCSPIKCKPTPSSVAYPSPQVLLIIDDGRRALLLSPIIVGTVAASEKGTLEQLMNRGVCYTSSNQQIEPAPNQQESCHLTRLLSSLVKPPPSREQ